MKFRSADGASRRIWMVIGVSALVLADVVLAVMAYISAHPPVAGSPSPIPRFSAPAPAPVAETTAAPSASPQPTAPPEVAAGRYMIALSSTEAMRSQGGKCTGSASVVERTSDGGRTWTPAPSDQGTVQKVLALGLSGGQVWSVAAAGAQCAPAYWSMPAAGGPWEGSDAGLPHAAYVDQDGHTLHTGQEGAEHAPCEAVQRLAVRPDGAAAVLCADGIWGRSAAGTTWTHLAVSGVQDIAPGRAGYLLVYSDAQTCAGLAFGSLPAGFGPNAAPNAIGCIADAKGPVALTSSGATVWLWAGESIRTSPDGGSTWRP